MEEAEIRKEFSDLLGEEFRLNGVSGSRLSSLCLLTKLSESQSHRIVPKMLMYACGSLVEGTMTQESDVDTFFVNPRERAFQRMDILSPNQHPAVNFRIKPYGKPGFSWLVLNLHDNNEKTNERDELAEVCDYCPSGDPNEKLVSSALYRKRFLMATEKGHPSSLVRATGVAFNVRSKYDETEYDFVFTGVKCTGWPDEAMEWVQRDRSNAWPNNELVENYKQYSCYLVPTGDPNSEHRSHEWRYAFVDLERELMWSFNDKQIQTFIILKILKKSYIDSIAPDQISSYILKNIIFWESEGRGQQYWNDRSLLQCVDLCLCKLEECIKIRVLPHYIIQRRNLLEGKLLMDATHVHVMESICDVRLNLETRFLECEITPLYSHHYGQSMICRRIWKHFPEDRDIFLKLYSLVLSHESPSLAHRRLRDLDESFNSKRSYALIEALSSTHTNVFFQDIMGKCLHLASGAQRLKTRNSKGDKYINSTVHTSHLNTLIAYATLEIERCENKNLRSKVEHLLCYSSEGCCESQQLHVATFHYVCGEKQKALETADDFCAKWGTCAYDGSGNENRKYEEVIYDRTGQVKSENFASDITFVSPHYESLEFPPAIEFELRTRKDPLRLSIHPLVFSLYLRFQIHFDSRNIEECRSILHHLNASVTRIHAEASYPTSIHFNILGLCLYNMGDFQDAVHAAEIFWKSLSLNSLKSNPAYYHLCALILKYGRK